MKKVLSVILASLMLLGVTACSGKSGDSGQSGGEETVRVGIVTDMGIDEAEWLQNLVAGLKDYTAQNEGIDIKVIEATDVAEYEPKVRALAEDSYDIIITMNSGMAGATTAVASDYPDIIFGSQNGNIENLSSYKNIEEFGLNRTETG